MNIPPNPIVSFEFRIPPPRTFKGVQKAKVVIYTLFLQVKHEVLNNYFSIDEQKPLRLPAYFNRSKLPLKLKVLVFCASA